MGAPTTEHPDLLDLDAIRTGEGEPSHIAHVATCTPCTQALADLQSLESSLKALSPIDTPVPPEIDAKILWQAKKHAMAVRKHSRRAVVPLQPRWAIAAALLIALGAATLWRQAGRVTAPVPIQVATNNDIDHNGTVDILDAFALARRGKNADADAVAYAAVSLSSDR